MLSPIIFIIIQGRIPKAACGSAFQHTFATWSESILLQRVLHIRRILPRLHTGEVEERRRSVFFRPERNGRIEREGVGHGRAELLSQTDRVVPRLALRHERRSKDSVREQQLHALRH
jgi:hypothetical protein